MSGFGLLSGRLKTNRPVATTRPCKAPEPAPSTTNAAAGSSGAAAAAATSGPERTKAIISDEVTLYTTKTKEPLSFQYEVTSTATKNVKFTMNFNGSVNFAAVDAAGKAVPNLAMVVTIPPAGKGVLGTVSLADTTKGARLEVEYDWAYEEPDPVKVKAAVEKNAKDIEAQAKPGSVGNLFIDPDFKAAKASLYTVNPTLISSGAESGVAPAGEQVAWYRPSEIYKDGKVDVFEGNIEPGDILQGALGDCWFLCAIACLAEFPALVDDLFPAESKKYNANGKYSVRICETGNWETVVVDDLIPCYPEGGPMYAKGHGNELWVMLLEKAYAKVCGSYAALKAGWAFEAMLDLTGAPYWTARFDDPDTQKAVEDGSLWTLILQNDALNYIQSASTPGEDVMTVGGDRKAKDGDSGLVAGHAYAVLQVKEVKSKGLKLLQLRNPWGEGGMEWNGDWSDNSPLWTSEIKRELGITGDLNPEDGAFWMSFTDFATNFYSVNACLVRHPDLGSSKWFESRKKMQFAMTGESDVKAPCYLLTLSEASDKVYFSMHQQDIRHVKSKAYVDFGVTVLQLNASTGKYSLIASSGNSADRQSQTKEMSLAAGQYLVVPTSTGAVLRTVPEKKLNATVVVHTTRPHGLVEQAFNAEAYEEAMELPVIKEGTVRELEGGLVKLYTRKSGFSGVSYVVHNSNTRDLKFTQDCSVGKNIISSNGSLKVTAYVPKGEAKVTHHLAPGTPVGAWQSGFSASYEWV